MRFRGTNTRRRAGGREPGGFSERSPARERGKDEARSRLLATRVCDLGLKIEGSRLEGVVRRLYDELEAAGIDLRPPVYLADEWGCPEAVPIIGVPFYLADERLAAMQDELLEDMEGRDEEEILAYLRHEAGHAFNYAYRLFETEEWRALFGPYSRPYLEDYRPRPFSRDYVRHIAGWYAQKHPDEDFAETFAVWLTPDSGWREAYRGWGCYPKLLYMERVARESGRSPPLVTAEGYDVGSEELRCSLEEYNARMRAKDGSVPPWFDADLRDIAAKAGRAGGEKRTAAQLLRGRRREMVRTINYWTGLPEETVRALWDHFAERCHALGLKVPADGRESFLLEMTVYASTLCMNKLLGGEFR